MGVLGELLPYIKKMLTLLMFKLGLEYLEYYMVLMSFVVPYANHLLVLSFILSNRMCIK